MRLKPIIIGTAGLLAWAGAAQARLNVVTTLTDFAVVAREIAGDKARVSSLAVGTEDPHFVDARPSFIRVLNRADILVDGGAELEIGWLPPLVNNARNRRILPGQPGRVDASRGVKLLNVPKGRVDRSQGDVHAAGNPHYMLDPLNARIVAARLADAMARADGKNAAVYRANLKTFERKIDDKLEEWKHRLESFRGTTVVSYHENFEYFAERFGLKIVGHIEPKPGIEPSPSHVRNLIKTISDEDAKLILIGPNRSPRTPEAIARRTGAKVLVLPVMAEGHPEADTYVNWIDYNVRQIAEALK